KMHPECYDADARALYQVAGDILGGGYCTYVRTLAQSMALNERTEPCVIISASGMCEAGRIRHHLKHNITNPKNTILLAGYQAANTLGRKLEQGAERIRLFQEEYAVRAEVRQIHGFSGHADQTELLRLLTPRASETRALYLVHGEPDQAQELADRLRAVGFRKVVVAERDRRYSL
ncbi:MAG TPA: MBL fold metallo-hydrolase RNA specificity domain-containing protein, partial [Phycisphaerae bacterium]|nr:MBL fold metallo-hydrolase RNA specificity domain-containing protein [Phycisphaerae bacterium]